MHYFVSRLGATVWLAVVLNVLGSATLAEQHDCSLESVEGTESAQRNFECLLAKIDSLEKQNGTLSKQIAEVETTPGPAGPQGVQGPRGNPGPAGKDGTSLSLPVGTIIAWFAVNSPVPTGWAICDGTNGTPDLRGKFLRGVGSMADAGNDAAATSTHRHTNSITDPTKANNSHVATCSQGCDDVWTSLFDHNHLGSIGGTSHIPPNFKVVYLMKTR